MRRKYLNSTFLTKLVEDTEEGYASLEMYESSEKGEQMVARIVFWDSNGQFFIEMATDELPLVLVEEMAKEARERIQTR